MSRLLHNPVSDFIDIVLRGVAEVFLQNNPLTGLIFLIGIFISSYVAGCYALLATIVATGTAMLLGVPRAEVEKGLYGYNGTLTGLALALYMRHDLILPAYVILAAIFVTIVTAFISDALNPYHVPILTSSFVLTSWIFLAALYSFGRLGGAAALRGPHLSANAALSGTVLTPNDALQGFFNGIGQVMLQQNVWTGVAFLVGLFVNSRISCAAAAAGSLIGIGVAWALGGEERAIREGLYGFNSVLTAVDLGGIYYLLSGRTALFTIVAAIVAAVAYGTLATILAPIGLPVLTAAFVIITWICLVSQQSLTRLQPIHPADITRAEDHLKAALLSRRL
jgi:urea transporter